MNPARIDPALRDDPLVRSAAARLAAVTERGLARLVELADKPLSSIHEVLAG